MRLPATSSIVVLTGAGISAESGVPVFRGNGGLWEGHRFEDVATPRAFARDPQMVHRFYNMRRAALGRVEPNPAHLALARLEKAWPGGFLLITQNVDDLHERAGSQDLVHLHGELRKARCEACGDVLSWDSDLSTETPCPACRRASALRPHIVWFGEMPFELERIQVALEGCGLFISIGTSGNVYPAAGFVEWVNPFALTVEMNLEAGMNSESFFEHRLGPASQTVPALVEELLSGLPEAQNALERDGIG